MAQRKIAILIGPGQSNEAGTGVKWGITTSLTDNATVSVRNPNIYGAPNLRSFSMSSMFDQLAGAIARRGIHVKLENLAVGGTGIVADWFGKLINHTVSTALAIGTWVLPAAPNGFKYLATNSATTGASAPAWPTTVGATVVDGGVTWRAYAATIKDVAGYVYMPGDDGYDPLTTLAGGPNGAGARMRAIMAKIQRYKSLGYEVWSIVQLGQQDVATNQTVGDMTACLASHVAQAIEAGADFVLPGVTNPYLLNVNIADWGSAPRPAPSAGGRVPPGTDGRIITARKNVLAMFAGSSKVRPGGDLSILNDNTITTETAAIANLHLGHVGQQVAGRIWFDQIVKNDMI